MRISDSQQYDMSLRNMQTQSRHLYDLRQEAASGKKNLRGSDDPVAYQRSLFLQAALTERQNFEEVSDRATMRLQGYDTTLGSLSDVVNSARTLALQGSSDGTDPAALKNLAANVDDLVKRAVSLGNEQQDGRYIFSGTMTGTRAFTYDESNGTVTFDGNLRAYDLALDNGDYVRASVPADEVFGSPPDGPTGLMGTLVGLRDALKAGDKKAIQGYATRLEELGDGVVAARGDVGTRMQHLQSLKAFRSSTVERLDLELSSVQDADMTQVVTDLVRQQTAFQAALQVTAQLKRNTLFDYIGR